MGNLVLAGATSGSITLEPTAVAGSTTLTLPTANGTILTTGSSGQSIPKAALPTGSVLQVVSTSKVDTFSTSSTTFVDITGLSVTITPTSSSSKIYIIAQVSSSGGNGNSSNFRLSGGNTSSYIGNAGGSDQQGVVGGYWNNNITGCLFSQSLIYLDSPATTSATTYTVQASKGSTGANQVQINFAIQNNGNDYVRGASSITVMEIAA